MTSRDLVLRSLGHYWRTNLAVIADARCTALDGEELVVAFPASARPSVAPP